MPNDPVPAAATGLPAPHHITLGETLFEMEDRVANLVRWAYALRDLGTCSADVSSDGLFAIGNAMLADAKAVQDDWRQCVELSRDLREGGR